MQKEITGTDNILKAIIYHSAPQTQCQVVSCKTLVPKVKKENTTEYQKWGEQTGCHLRGAARISQQS